MASDKLRIESHGPIRELRLNRPDVHNAFDEELIAALTGAFEQITNEVEDSKASPDAIRGILLTGEGKSFCAGADLNYMKAIASFGEQENLDDARRLSAMFQTIRSCPVYVLASVRGAVLGGGTGLIAACDRVIASDQARFGFTEVRLGIIPATISPFVLERIGPSRGRALFPTGEIFSAEEALRIGLVDRVVPEEELDATVDSVLKALLSAGPIASRDAKQLVEQVTGHLPLRFAAKSEEPSTPPDPIPGTVYEQTAKWIAQLRGSTEGREGMKAFLEKRRPSWVRPATRPQ